MLFLSFSALARIFIYFTVDSAHVGRVWPCSTVTAQMFIDIQRSNKSPLEV